MIIALADNTGEVHSDKTGSGEGSHMWLALNGADTHRGEMRRYVIWGIFVTIQLFGESQPLDGCSNSQMNEEGTERCDLKRGKKSEETEIKEKGGIGSPYQYRSPSPTITAA